MAWTMSRQFHHFSDYIVVKVRCVSSVFEALASLCYLEDCVGIEEIDQDASFSFKAYFTSQPIALIAQLKSNPKVDFVQVSEFRLTQLDNYIHQFEPFKLGRFEVVPFSKNQKQGSANTYTQQNSISLQPAWAFGTGEHATTQLMIKLIEQFESFLDRKLACIDLGTGTGILTLYLAKLGFKKLYACEIDSLAFENAQKNFSINQTQVHLTDELQQLNQAGQLILANVLSSTLLELSLQIKERLRAGGYLFLSGIIKSDREKILAAYRELKLVTELQKQDWLALCFQKK